MVESNDSQLAFCKIRKVKSPTRAHEFDAGIDFFVPEDLTEEIMKSKFETSGSFPETVVNEDGIIKDFKLKPGDSVLIPSGIKMKVPAGYMLQFNNKSGIATKRGLMVGASVVDIGYEGECHINLYNVSRHDAVISAGDKICQGILVKVGFQIPVEAENEEDLYGTERSERGAGGFGSSGVK